MKRVRNGRIREKNERIMRNFSGEAVMGTEFNDVDTGWKTEELELDSRQGQTLLSTP